MPRMLPRTGPVALLVASLACGADPVTPAADAASGVDAAVAPDARVGVDAQPGEDAAPPVPDGGVVLPPCDPALAITPVMRAVGALQLVSFEATGGAGEHRFGLATDASGAIINELTGAYLSGDRTGVVDRIALTDRGCVGAAVADIRVVEALVVRPSSATVRPRTAFTFDVQGGSGRYTFTLVNDRSGATLTATGAYAAGPSNGLDQVRVEDLETGDVVRVEILIDPTTRMIAEPSDVYLALGSRLTLATRGGSGEVALEPAPDLVIASGGTLTGTRAGSRMLTLTDPFTGDTARVRVTVAAPQAVPAERAGNAFFVATAIGPGDLDGDGRPDAIFALPDHDLTSNTGGAVMVYRGAAGGLSPAPAQIIGGETRFEELGRGVAVADVDGDGELDLLIGAPRADISGVDSGAVRIHLGIAGGLFSDRPSKVLSGRFASDLFGSAVSACDFNGDGLMDLAISARGAEDRGRSPVTNDQGAVHIFIQRATGFRDEPDQSLWGDVPDDTGSMVGRGGMLFGLAVATGDLDGDGACDLAASSIDYDRDPASNTNDGLVYVYRGVAAASGARGGLSADPVIGWASTSTADIGANLGRALTIGELNGDSRAELVMLAPLGDTGNGDNHGIIRIRAGAPLPTAPITRLSTAHEIDWAYAHTGDQDQFGYQASIGDLTGDGVPDLVVGALRDEVMGSPGDSGAVALFEGRQGMLPSPLPSAFVPGLASGDAFGAALAVIGDLDGDMRDELLVFATTADTWGRDEGATYLVNGRLDRAPEPLEFPGVPSGVEAGRGADLVGDLDGDGRLDLVVGAPRDNSPTLGLNTGSAYLYLGTASGVAAAPALIWRHHPTHGAGDTLGQFVSRAGDFDGDGRDDVAIVARTDDRPSTFAAADFAPEASCAGLPAANDVGAVLVYRGARGLPSDRPSAMIFGVEAGDVIDGVLGGFDYDGDGIGDLLIASASWDTAATTNTGGVALVRGRAADATGRIQVICEYDYVLHLSEANSGAGRSLTSLGDLDGDGCDDVAFGAPTEDLGNTDQGSVRVLYGFGAGCTAGPRIATLVGGTRAWQAGFAIASEGRDVDGDGIADLIVGVPNQVAGGNVVGGARLLSGAALRAAATETPRDGVAPSNLTPMTGPTVLGWSAGGGFGRSVAMGDGGVWIGAPTSDYAGVVASGGLTFHAYNRTTDEFGAAAQGTMSGESFRELGRVGELLMSFSGAPYVLVAGYDGQGGGRDLGSAYVLRVR